MNENLKSNRLVFIDLIRAFAILMMVQGHSIELTLKSNFKDLSYIIYSIWAHLRGLTAPTFFFSSGIIFTYLLFREGNTFKDNKRAKKGIKRGIFLLMLGYILRLQPEQFTDIGNYKYSMLQKALAVDTLHTIGIGLILIVILWLVSNKLKINYAFISIIIALIILFLSPWINLLNSIKFMPLFFANFFTNKYGSNFPLVPWETFVLLGSTLGYFLSKTIFQIKNKKHLIVLLMIGVIIAQFSDKFLLFMFNLSSYEGFIILYKNNFLLLHIGNVLILTFVFAMISNVWKNPSSILQKIGQNTLLIYIVHIFIIYGTGFTIGLKYFFESKLGPWESIVLALLIIIINIASVITYDRFSYKFKLLNPINSLKKIK